VAAPPGFNFDHFIDQVGQLRISEWSTRFSDRPLSSLLPSFLAEELSRDEKLDFAVDLALLPHLYGREYDNCSYMVLEAYLWSQAGKRQLAQLGWLEGNVVIVDFWADRVSVPQVDSTTTTLSTPYLWLPENEGISSVLGRLDGKLTPLRQRLNESCNLRKRGGRLLRGLCTDEFDLEDKLHVLLRDLGARSFYDAPTVIDRLTTPVLSDATLLFEGLGGAGPVSQAEWERQLHQSLHDRLLHVLVVEELATNRGLDRQSVTSPDKRSEFTYAFRDFARRTSIELQRGILFVDDGELSLLCLEYCFGADERIEVAGQTIYLPQPDNDEVYQALGLFRGHGLTRRAWNMIWWLKRFLDPALPEHERAPMRERWKAAPIGKSDAEVLRAKIAQVEQTPSPAAFRELNRVIFSSAKRSPRDINSQHWIRLPIHLFLRYAEPEPRHLIAFPLTHTGLQTVQEKRIAAYFLGSVTDPPGTSELVGPTVLDRRIRQHIEIKRFVEQSFANTLHVHYQRTIQAGQAIKSLSAASFVFGHETKNRADAIEANVHKQTIRQFLNEAWVSPTAREPLERMAEAFTLAEDLYGISELVSQLAKLATGELPEKWVLDDFRDRVKAWPDDFRSRPDWYLSRWAASCKEYIRSSISPYLAKFRRKYPGKAFELREIVGDRPQIREPLLVTGDPPNLELPPFHSSGDNRAPAIALLAGVAEHLRNAARYLIEPDNAGLVARRFTAAHIDYQVECRADDLSLVIRFWNPCVHKQPPLSATIEIMVDLFRIIGTRSVHPADETEASPSLGEQLAATYVEPVPLEKASDAAIEIRPATRKHYPLGSEAQGEYVCSEVVFRPERFRFG
jgi:hypothetical protein